MDTETSFIMGTDSQTIIDNDSKLIKDILPIFSYHSRTAPEVQATLVILSDDRNLNNASSRKEDNAPLVLDWSFEDIMAHLHSQNSFLCWIPHTSQEHGPEETDFFSDQHKL